MQLLYFPFHHNFCVTRNNVGLFYERDSGTGRSHYCTARELPVI